VLLSRHNQLHPHRLTRMRYFLLVASCLCTLGSSTSPAQGGRQRLTPGPPAARAVRTPRGRPHVADDLLLHYATKPAGVTLLRAQPGAPGSQTLAVATYQVHGAAAWRAEQFFRTHYGMGPLQFVCCGWEPAAGKLGQVASAPLRNLNPNYRLVVTMFSKPHALEQAMLTGTPRAWRDRRQVTQFIIEVTLLDV